MEFLWFIFTWILWFIKWALIGIAGLFIAVVWVGFLTLITAKPHDYGPGGADPWPYMRKEDEKK